MNAPGDSTGSRGLGNEDHWTSWLCDAAQQCEAAFHFEEGGCVAFAIAAAEQLTSEGRQAHLALANYTSHAVTIVDGIVIDHQGIHHRPESDFRIVDEVAMLQTAESWAVLEMLPSDLEWAQQMITIAIDMANEQGRQRHATPSA